MIAPACETCAHMRRDEAWRMRCHSPELVEQKMPGLLCVFERHGEGGCGQTAKNWKGREG
jgi:hypothetical protein